MKISQNVMIQIEIKDITLLKKYIKYDLKADKDSLGFKRHSARYGIDEDGIKLSLSNHHIISRSHIKSWLINLLDSSVEKEIKKIFETYLNDPRNEQLRESLNYEYSKAKDANKEFKIIYYAFLFNPKNLIVGPAKELRMNDPNDELDFEILSKNDSAIIPQLINSELSMCEKISMLANNEKRGVSTWIKEPQQNIYSFKEDMERIGQNVCQWYVEGFDEPEHPEKCINLPDGTLVKFTRRFFQEMMAPIQSFFYSLKSKVFS